MCGSEKQARAQIETISTEIAVQTMIHTQTLIK